jgi:conflict system STAND superfamily ATPase/mechanosensitive ion channel-like protein
MNSQENEDSERRAPATRCRPHPLQTLKSAEFKGVIEGPAARATAGGHPLKVEPGLSERLIRDAEGADALPLLAFTLERLYMEYGSAGRLRSEDYEALGGVRGSIEAAVDALFAGMHKPIRVGDYVKLAEGVEGHVLDVGWRSTRLRTLHNNTVILPNQKVAQSIITNYDMPESRIALPVGVGVEYGTDADHLEEVLLDEGTRATKEIPGFLGHPAPVVRLGFGESSLDATLHCHVGSFIDQFAAQHELRKRLLHRFSAKGIRLAYPVRTVPFEPVDGDCLPPAPATRTDTPS